MKVWAGFGVMQCHAIFWTRSRKRPDRPESFWLPRRLAKPQCACDWHPIFLRFQHHPRALFSRIEPVRKPCGSRSTCHWHVGLSNRSAVEKMAPKVAFAKQKQLAQKAVGSRDHCTSRVCSGLVDGVAEGCNIGSPVALAKRVDAN